MSCDIMLSDHAAQRSLEWNVSFDEIAFVVEHADRLHRAGVIFCQMRKKNMPEHISGNHPYWKLVGTSVLLCRKCRQGVMTVYREEKAFLEDRKKAKYCRRRNRCPVCSNQS